MTTNTTFEIRPTNPSNNNENVSNAISMTESVITSVNMETTAIDQAFFLTTPVITIAFDGGLINIVTMAVVCAIGLLAYSGYLCFV